jgi:hypothetical protein
MFDDTPISSSLLAAHYSILTMFYSLPQIPKPTPPTLTLSNSIRHSLATFRPFDLLTCQPSNLSTIQLFNPLTYTTIQPFPSHSSVKTSEIYTHVTQKTVDEFKSRLDELEP